MSFPIHDWQFWVVSGIALIGILIVLRPFWPKRDRSTGCGGCPTQGTKHKPRRVRLTLGRTDPQDG